jgi:hypothetical protein
MAESMVKSAHHTVEGHVVRWGCHGAGDVEQHFQVGSNKIA